MNDQIKLWEYAKQLWQRIVPKSPISFLNRLSIYWDPYMHTVDSEYWWGYHRKKIATFDSLTIWVRRGG